MNHAKYFVDISYFNGLEYSGWVLRVWGRNPNVAEAIKLGNSIPDYTDIEFMMDKMELVLEEAAQQSVQRTGGESGQQSLFSAGEVLPAKVTRQSTRH